ncbi:hypothetical protein Q5741_13250 [Paenibacillus sp. JX-17]|uniref:Uncharacterized protein n=1 Tax=Paenibacillus lacisoli TaxID=3064525 RepID=A0ABT9CFM0_9BACL|nr:hypothetical protein [Paenibacillus sp. JX-17]MDO7907373.1 hypothetical protein [Paenibacillus sp. JX-17]
MNRKRLPAMLRVLILAVLCLTQMFSCPILIQEDPTAVIVAESSSATSEVNVLRLEAQNKPVIRSNSTAMQKLTLTLRSLPLIFLLIPLIPLLRFPAPRLHFHPVIRLLKRRLFLEPIKYTSRFVA